MGSGPPLVDTPHRVGSPLPRTAAVPRTPGAPHQATAPGRAKRKRVSKWDRPPPPKDWRFFVGGLGKILIALGLLTFGFVGYQLFGTAIETWREQNRLGEEFNTVAPGAGAIDPAPVPTFPASQLENPPVDPGIAQVASADGQNLPSAPEGAIMKLEIPKIDVVQYVVPGVGVNDLKKGVGHFPTSPWPGQLGKAGLAGHRTTYGQPFFRLDQLEPGDEIIITRIDGNQYVYAVTDNLVVEPKDSWVLDGEPNEATLMMLTCTPVHSATHRLVVNAKLLPERSAVVGEATFYQHSENLDGDDGLATEAGQAEAGEFVPRDAETGAPETTFASPGLDAEAAGIDTDVDAADVPSASGFDRGWFEDPDAWPIVGVWGAALLVIYLLSRIISRWSRRTWVGFIVTAAPFLYCVYFFYQGVERLLPAGI